MRKIFLIYEEMREYLVIYEKAVKSFMTLTPSKFSLFFNKCIVPHSKIKFFCDDLYLGALSLPAFNFVIKTTQGSSSDRDINQRGGGGERGERYKLQCRRHFLPPGGSARFGLALNFPALIAL